MQLSYKQHATFTTKRGDLYEMQQKLDVYTQCLATTAAILFSVAVVYTLPGFLNPSLYW